MSSLAQAAHVEPSRISPHTCIQQRTQAPRPLLRTFLSRERSLGFISLPPSSNSCADYYPSHDLQVMLIWPSKRSHTTARPVTRSSHTSTQSLSSPSYPINLIIITFYAFFSLILFFQILCWRWGSLGDGCQMCSSTNMLHYVFSCRRRRNKQQRCTSHLGPDKLSSLASLCLPRRNPGRLGTLGAGRSGEAGGTLWTNVTDVNSAYVTDRSSFRVLELGRIEVKRWH